MKKFNKFENIRNFKTSVSQKLTKLEIKEIVVTAMANKICFTQNLKSHKWIKG